MVLKQKLTPAFVARPPIPVKDRALYWEGSLGLMVTAKGHKSFVVQYRAGRTSRRVTLKAGLSLQEARREAKAILGAVAKGGDPVGEKRKAVAAEREIFQAICKDFLEREGGMTRDADGNLTFGGKMRTANEWERNLRRLVCPVLGSRPVVQIKRSEIVKLLDRVEDDNGPFMAQKVQRYLSRIFNWYAGRSDDFRSPMVRIEREIEGSSRERTLTDDELKAVWRAAETTSGPYGYFVMFCLLTATRRGEAAQAAWSEFQNDDWIIPAARMKAKVEHLVPLSPKALKILETLPRIGPYVFTYGKTPIADFSGFKARLNEKSGVSNWRLHDLRRTARSLMSRAGVLPDIAERCLAHTIGGIRGVYDRHAYHKEKKAAFAALAMQIERIINPAKGIT
jgi:integrase